MTEDLIEALKKLAAPPTSPVDAGTPDLWDDVEARLGTKLPRDYKAFVNVYGSGEFNDLITIWTPFHPRVECSLFRYQLLLEEYDRARLLMPEACPFSSFPEPGGLLPMGTDSNGNTLFWLTVGHSDAWHVIYYDYGAGYVAEPHEMGIVELLVGWLAGIFPDCFGGAGSAFLGKTTPTFRPAPNH